MKRCTEQGVGEGHGASTSPPGTTLPTSPHVRKLSEPCHFGFLWRLHSIGMIEEVTGHCGLLQPLAPLSSLEVRGWD